MTTQQNKIFRFKFDDSVVDEMKEFSRIHKFDDRDDFKDAWEKWLIENKDMVSNELARLQKLGYNGDIEDKMFKSVRYYYRKKSNEKSEPKKRRKYVSLGKEILLLIDTHIERGMVNDKDYKPSIGFDDFVNTYQNEIKDVFDALTKQDLKNNEITNKIKKTYKNRYFIKQKK